MNTQSELNGLLLDWVGCDLTASTGTNGIFTLDENETSDPNVHAFQIVSGDISALKLDTIVHASATSVAPTY